MFSVFATNILVSIAAWASKTFHFTKYGRRVRYIAYQFYQLLSDVESERTLANSSMSVLVVSLYCGRGVSKCARNSAGSRFSAWVDTYSSASSAESSSMSDDIAPTERARAVQSRSSQYSVHRWTDSEHTWLRKSKQSNHSGISKVTCKNNTKTKTERIKIRKSNQKTLSFCVC